LRAFSDSCSRVVRRRLTAPLASVHGPLTRLAAPGNHRAPTPAGRRESSPTPTPSFDVGRPHAVGVARARMVRLALGGVHRQAGDRRRVAPARLSLVLDVEEPPPDRPPGRAAGRSRVDSRHVHRESAVGCAADSRGTTEARDLGQ